MRKWFVLGGIALVVVVAASAFAVQQFVRIDQVAQVEEVQPLPKTASYSGCGSGNCSAGDGAFSSCSGGSGGCGGPALSPEQASVRNDQIKSFVFNYYSQKLGDQDIIVQVQDYGCHQEDTVAKGDQIIKRLSISGKNISEIG
ncbi:hypothetical protein EP232_05280 [bacterium]|nr:MAG: hypothetical protein EP232_05280 [bacterium]